MMRPFLHKPDRGACLLYVLDMDDTLYLERDFVRSGFQAVDRWLKEKHGIDNFFENAWRLFEEGRRGNIFDLALAELEGVKEVLVQQMLDVYRSHEPVISLLPDASEFFSAHVPEDLAIITDGYPHVQWAKIKALQLDRLVDQIIVTGDWGQAFWKPHHRAFIQISQGHESSECVYIGDNPMKDFKAPDALGWMASIRMRRKGSLHYKLETPESCIEVSSFEYLRV